MRLVIVLPNYFTRNLRNALGTVLVSSLVFPSIRPSIDSKLLTLQYKSLILL